MGKAPMYMYAGSFVLPEKAMQHEIEAEAEAQVKLFIENHFPKGTEVPKIARIIENTKLVLARSCDACQENQQ
jgi:hypothetical protein